MDLTIVPLWTICDDLLIAIGHQEHPQTKMSDGMAERHDCHTCGVCLACGASSASVDDRTLRLTSPDTANDVLVRGSPQILCVY